MPLIMNRRNRHIGILSMPILCFIVAIFFLIIGIFTKMYRATGWQDASENFSELELTADMLIKIARKSAQLKEPTMDLNDYNITVSRFDEKDGTRVVFIVEKGQALLPVPGSKDYIVVRIDDTDGRVVEFNRYRD